MQTVVHLLSGDEAEQETALAIARNLLEDETDSIDDVAIVVQSKGIATVTADGDSVEDVEALLEDGVSVRACSNTLEMMDLEESDLLEGVETVPEGAVEVTRLQEEGYGYLRP
ncbi:DsrE family protein [Halostagnicola sp. A-GB9-2]|uniref:DsrE family protein n=1 Tax=Halostagnicola sp. A-GB9-2 TaxID=3048066 RepID=UPI0024BF84C4|nr:DsrE family protein [Halostagnicola sp. A-GB9-2]MDJ1431939.1 DsrE family protein [Halostagnicola sp. A-GB9-2]